METKFYQGFVSSQHQTALFLELENETYGLLSCQMTKQFYRVPKEDMTNFEHMVKSSKNLSEIIDPNRDAIKRFVKAIESSKEMEIVPMQEVNEVLNSLNLK